MPPLMGNEGDTRVSEGSHLQRPQLLAHPSSLPSRSCPWPFLFNTITHSLSVSLSLCPPPLSLTPDLSISRSVSPSILCISYAYNLCVRPDQMDLPSHQRFIFYFKSKRDTQPIVRDSFCCASNPPPPHRGAGAGRATLMHFYLRQVT